MYDVRGVNFCIFTPQIGFVGNIQWSESESQFLHLQVDTEIIGMKGTIKNKETAVQYCNLLGR